MPVLLYHLDVPLFGGGFIGVDVFFVISGYLITGLITEQCASNKFTFRQFYWRRARRLLPALLFTLILSFLSGFFLLSPAGFERLGEVTLASLISLSNVYFWQESGYFDIDAHLKPLLHTWTLSVEEQFYLFWPAVLSLLILPLNKHKQIGLITVLLIGGVILSQVYLTYDPAGAFFLLPFRMAEFIVGASLVWLLTDRLKKWFVLELYSLIGLLLIVISVVSFDENMNFPGISALLPSLGAALVIAGYGSPFLNRMVGLPLLVWIGRRSYSLYLIHWPLIVYYQHYTQQELDNTGKIALTCVSITFAALMYRYIENRFRISPGVNSGTLCSPKKFVGITLGAIGIITVSSVLASTQQGWKWRFDPGMKVSEMDLETEKAKRESVVRTLCKEKTVASTGCIDQEKINVLVVGNSHAVDGLNVIHAIFEEEHNYILSGAGGCPPLPPEVAITRIKKNRVNYASCMDMNEARFTKDFYQDVDYVVISVMFNVFTPKDLAVYASYLKSVGIKRIVMLGSHYKLKSDMYDALVITGSIEDVIAAHMKHDFRYNDEVREVCRMEGCLFVDKQLLLCDEGVGCKYEIDGIPFTWDKGHLTYEFAEYIGLRSAPIIKEYLALQE